MNSLDNIDLSISIRLICKPSEKRLLIPFPDCIFLIPIFPRINLVAAKYETKEPQNAPRSMLSMSHSLQHDVHHNKNVKLLLKLLK